MNAMHSLLKRPEAGTLTDARAQWLRKIKPAEEPFDNQTVPPGERPGPWRVYTSPLEYTRSDTLRAVAQRIGYRESRVSIGW